MSSTPPQLVGLAESSTGHVEAMPPTGTDSMSVPVPCPLNIRQSLLVVVLGLLLYSISARDPHAAPGLFDWLQVVLVVSALAADAVALWAIGARIDEFGLSPNRVAALGENVLLLINLAGSAVLYLLFLTGRGSFQSLERWQTGYLPVYAAWAAVVVVVFPVVF